MSLYKSEYSNISLTYDLLIYGISDEISNLNFFQQKSVIKSSPIASIRHAAYFLLIQQSLHTAQDDFNF